ncbi:MAG: type IV secretory system conjugative DNA transfer family protein [Candidatus Wildermuthbacteria bacterium]|nr:type IV secretory system conjugative DNA transfer family protein [Candidatus Wildermuthbacteria bacterium]
MRLRNTPFFPIATYKSLEQDPLGALTNALSKIQPDEGAALQVVIRPVSKGHWRGYGENVIKHIREGKPLKQALADSMRGPLAQMALDVFNGLTQGNSSEKKQQEQTMEAEKKKKEDQAGDDQIVEAIRQKTQKEVFDVNIRIIVSAQTQARAEEIFGHFEGAFGQFSRPPLNNFEIVKLRKKSLKKLIYDFSFRNFSNAYRNILNTEELASIYHFPTKFTETPYIKSAKGSAAAPPANLPAAGPVVLGVSKFRGEERKVFFASRGDRRRHFYVVGQTGTGKTSMLQEMIRQDIENGEGVGVVDPHGELVEAALACVPKDRVKDVVLFEPFDLERPSGLNMLEYDTPEQKDFAVQEMITIFHKLFPPEIIGPMFEHNMRNALLALMADHDNPGTLAEIPRIFTDDEFLQAKLQKVADPMVRNFWLKEWKQLTGSTKSDMLGYIVSKVGRFVENDMMRNIIGQSHSSFNLEAVMDEKKIFLANLSKGMTGEVNSSLLGLILVSKMQMAAMKRARIAEEDRQDFYLYIDEFQNFTTDSIAVILSEARKYRLSLIMAHQYIPQLTNEIKNAVLGNAGTIGAFRVGAEDAEFLEKHFTPEFSKFDLMNLDNFNLAVKMLINNMVSSAFQIQTLPPQKGNKEMVEPIKNISKLKYGRKRFIVESEILERAKL